MKNEFKVVRVDFGVPRSYMVKYACVILSEYVPEPNKEIFEVCLRDILYKYGISFIKQYDKPLEEFEEAANKLISKWYPNLL